MPYPAWYTGDPSLNAAIEAALAEQATGNTAAFVPKVKTINAQTGTAYTPVPGDVGKIVTLSNASAITCTLDKDADQAVPIGGEITFIQIGAGLVTFAAESGATIHKIAATLKSNGQYSKIVAIKTAANTWNLNGDLSAT